jgi:hypothetical protein
VTIKAQNETKKEGISWGVRQSSDDQARKQKREVRTNIKCWQNEMKGGSEIANPYIRE